MVKPAGRRVLVTRAAHQAGKLSDALRALGLEPVEVPVLEIQPPESFAPLDAAIRQLCGFQQDAPNKKDNVILSESPEENPAIASESPDESTVILSESPEKSSVILDKSTQRRVEGSAAAVPSPSNDEGCPILPPPFGGRVGDRESQPSDLGYDWLILTSANTVKSVANRATTLGLTLANYAGQVAAIGEATAAAAREAGLTVSLIPDTYVAESLVASLKNQAAGKRILIARAAIARDVIPDALRAAGTTVDVVDAYRNAIPDSAPAQLGEALEQGIDAVTFTSSSSVTHLAAVAKQANIPFPFANIPAISIGPITTQTLIEHNWPPAVEASPSDIPGLASAVASVLR